ncbi:unnamed protein product [Cunninghamella echinulata]
MKKYGFVPSIPPLPTQKILSLSHSERDLLQSHQPGYGSRSRTEVGFNWLMQLPFALYKAGFICGIIMSVFVSIISQLGLYMLITAGQRVHIYKFATLVEYIMGRPGYHFLNIMIFIQAGGACLSYLILIGDTLPVLLDLYLPQFPILSNRTLVLVTVSCLLIFPLNLSRSIGAVAKWSIVSVLCLPVILLTLLIRAPAYASSHDTSSISIVGPDLFGAVAIMAFAFACSQVAFNNFLTLKEQTSRAWAQAVTIAAIISYVVSMGFAIIGYLSFGENVQPNLFLNFPQDDSIINIGRFALGFSMILTVPMAFYPAREAIQKTLGFETSEKQPNAYQHYGITILISILLTILGIHVRSIGKVYALIGGFAATTLAYIIPATAYLKTRSISKYTQEESKQALLQHDNLSHHSGESSNNRSTTNGIMTPAPTSTRRGTEVEENEEEQQILVEEEPIVIDLDDGKPCWFLDIGAVLLIVWGFVVMFFSTKSVIMD